MKPYALIVNDDPKFGPGLLGEFLRGSRPPALVVATGRFSEGESRWSRLRYSLVMLTSLGPRFCLSYLRSGATKIEAKAKEAGVSFRHVSSVNCPEFVNELKSGNYAFVASVHSQIYSKDTLKALPMPIFNFHGGLLPQNRSRYPFFWSCYLGHEQVITCHQVSARIDEGPVLFTHLIDPKPAKNPAAATTSFALGLPKAIARLADLPEDERVGVSPLPLPYRPAPSWEILRLWANPRRWI